MYENFNFFRTIFKPYTVVLVNRDVVVVNRIIRITLIGIAVISLNWCHGRGQSFSQPWRFGCWNGRSNKREEQ